jgi:hypothetical protein
MRCALFIFISVLLLGHGFATPHTFQEQNFSVDIPSGWLPLRPLPPGALDAFQSPQKSERLVIFAAKVSANKYPHAEVDTWQSAKKAMTDGGLKFDPERKTALGGLSFITASARLPSGGSLTAYTAARGNDVYMLQAFSMAAVDSPGSQLQSAVQSFRLVSPESASAKPSSEDSSAARSGAAAGHVFFYGLLVVGVIVIFRLFTPKRR